jgi:hypothetical protein
MSHKEYLRRCEQERAEAKAALKTCEDTFDAAVAANPALYKTVKQTARDARRAFNDIESEYQKLTRAQTAGRGLKAALQDCKLDAKEFIDSVALLALIGMHLQSVN